MKPNEQVMKPFFAQFLEAQQTAKRQESEKNNWTSKLSDAPDQTLKYPSDGDEEWWLL